MKYPAYKEEILIVEDGSTARTLEMCMEYVEAHPEVKIVHRSSFTGKSSAQNFAVNQSQADIVAIFDADNKPDDWSVY